MRLWCVLGLSVRRQESVWRVSTCRSVPLKHPLLPTVTLRDYSVETTDLVQASSQRLSRPATFPPSGCPSRGLTRPPNSEKIQLRDRKKRKGISVYLFPQSFSCLFLPVLTTGCTQLPTVWFIQFTCRHPFPVHSSFVSGCCVLWGWSVRAKEQWCNQQQKASEQQACSDCSTRVVPEGWLARSWCDCFGHDQCVQMARTSHVMVN